MSTTTARGTLLPCPLCGQAEATIDLSLADLDTLHCQDCDTDFTVANVRQFIAQWQSVLSWIEAFPR